MATYAEQMSGITAPTYNGTADPNGKLYANYTYDPTKSEAFQKMQGIAESNSLSPWASMQMQSNQNDMMSQRDQVNAQAMGGTSQANQQLMATGGGTNSGASAFLASQGAKNAMLANQSIGALGSKNALNIEQTDAQNKQTMLGQVATAENAGQAANISTALNNNQASNAFYADQYKNQMAAWGAQQTANAQTATANSGKK